MTPLRLTTQTLGVLSAMLSDPGQEWYGLELCKQAHLKPGTIYPILVRLLKAGWLERRWEEVDPKTEGRPRRRLYRLTSAGAPAARESLDGHLLSLQQHAPGSWRFRPVPMNGDPGASIVPSSRSEGSPPLLTPRERDVLLELCRPAFNNRGGRWVVPSNAQIADRLLPAIGAERVSDIMSSIYRKFELAGTPMQNRAALVELAIDHRLVGPDD